tara:strand:+ start:247389 stop:248330 length:942 start_codon:yes stop_codon:yes gene_type:complete
MNQNKLPIISVIGPTSIGKTKCAIALAKIYPVEIISVDSTMIYKEMDIGTDKPDTTVLNENIHHLIDIKYPNEKYNVGNFYYDSIKLIKNIHKRKKIPLFVGGTLMYFYQLFNGLNKLPPASSSERNFINYLANMYGWDKIYTSLKYLDSAITSKINVNDHQRIQRSLEVYLMTGKPLSFFHSSTESLSDIYELITLKISLNDRNKLHTIIEERTKKMFDSGLIDEVKYLKDKYELDLSYQSMKAIGYSHVMNFLYGKLNEKDLLQKVIFSTRQLAKRQITWLKKFPSKYQLDNASNITKLIFNKIDKHLQYL